MLFNHIWKQLRKKTSYNQSKRRKDLPVPTTGIFHFTLQSYSPESTGLKLEIKFEFICSFILEGSRTPDPGKSSGSGATPLLNWTAAGAVKVHNGEGADLFLG